MAMQINEEIGKYNYYYLLYAVSALSFARSGLGGT